MPDIPEKQRRILQAYKRYAGQESDALQEPLIQIEADDETKREPLIESAGGTYGKPIQVCFAGVGTCGVNILMSLKSQISKNEQLVDFVGINSDGGSIRELEKNGFQHNIGLGDDSHYLGTGGDLATAKAQAEDHFEEFVRTFKDADLALVVTGMGGGTGTGAAPYVAKAAKKAQENKRNALTIGVTTMPNLVELDRFEIAEQGIEELKKHVDALIVIDQARIEEVLGDEDASADLAYELVDLRFQTVLQSIIETVTKYTKRNIDFADVCSTLKMCGEAIITTVEAPSENVEEIKKKLSGAINDKLLFNHSGKVASRLLVYHFYEHGYSQRKHFEVVSEVQKLFGWTKKEGHTIPHYSCVLGNLPEDSTVKKFLKIGNDSGDEYKGKTKVIVMAGGFVDVPQTSQVQQPPQTKIVPIPPPAKSVQPTHSAVQQHIQNMFKPAPQPIPQTIPQQVQQPQQTMPLPVTQVMPVANPPTKEIPVVEPGFLEDFLSDGVNKGFSL
jgi:cell division protein FtsZ